MPKRSFVDGQQKITSFFSTVRHASSFHSPSSKRVKLSADEQVERFACVIKSVDTRDAPTACAAQPSSKTPVALGCQSRTKKSLKFHQDKVGSGENSYPPMPSLDKPIKFIIPNLNSAQMANLRTRMLSLDRAVQNLANIQSKCPVTISQSKSAILNEEDESDFGAIEDPLADVLSEETDFLLPQHYRDLLKIFRAIDLYVGISCCRKQQPRFRKMTDFVNRILRRNLEYKHLGQIKTVYPNAYKFVVQEVPISERESSTSAYDIAVLPCFNDDIPQIKSKSQEEAVEYPPLMSPVKVKMKMSPLKLSPNGKRAPSEVIVNIDKYNLETNRQRLRLEILRQHLQSRLINEHRKFLMSLEPPVLLSEEEEKMLRRWHPAFPLEKVPQIEVAEMPELPTKHRAMTVCEFLKMATSSKTVPAKIQEAAEKVQQINCAKANESEKTPLLDEKFVAAVKGLPKHLLAKVREKQAAKQKELMFRTQDETVSATRKSHLYDLAVSMKYVYACQNRTCISKTSLVEEWRKTFPQYTDYDEHLELMCSLVPEWVSLRTFNKTEEFVKVTCYDQCKATLDKLKQISNEARDYLVYGK